MQQEVNELRNQVAQLTVALASGGGGGGGSSIPIPPPMDGAGIPVPPPIDGGIPIGGTDGAIPGCWNTGAPACGRGAAAGVGAGVTGTNGLFGFKPGLAAGNEDGTAANCGSSALSQMKRISVSPI